MPSIRTQKQIDSDRQIIKDLIEVNFPNISFKLSDIYYLIYDSCDRSLMSSMYNDFRYLVNIGFLRYRFNQKERTAYYTLIKEKKIYF